MWQGLLNGSVSFRLSVCPIYRPLQQRAACLLLGDIDRLLHGHRAPAATAPQQHGGQQQMRAASRLQPPYKAGHNFFYNSRRNRAFLL